MCKCVWVLCRSFENVNIVCKHIEIVITYEYNHNKKVYNCKNSLSKHNALGDFKELSKIEEENKKSEQAFTYKKTKDYNYTHKNKSIERSIQNDHVKFFIFRRLIFPRRRKFQLSRR